MPSAPGGQLAIEEIFGRDEFIASVWRTLGTNSIRMEAERRIGKTHILRKMEAQPPTNWDAILLDLEHIRSAAEFAEKVCGRVHERLTGWKKHGKRVAKIVEFLGGAEVASLKFPDKSARPDNYWKTLLISTIEDLVEQQEAVGKRVVFLFDELPWMLEGIAQAEGEPMATQVLDVLRSLRQSSTTGRAFRMVLCGSIGLHHVLKSFGQHGYNNQPVNDMTLIEVPPLDPALAVELAQILIAGDGLTSDPSAAKLIAEQTGGFPFYIHWVISSLTVGGKSATAAEIEVVIKRLLTAPHDPCSFRQFQSRISIYYPQAEKPVLALLDHAAVAPAPLLQSEFSNVAKSTGVIDNDRVRELLRLLAVDHYLTRDIDGRYSFRHALLRRWWIIEREL